MDLSAIALLGLDQAQAQMEGAVAAIVSMGALSSDTGAVDTVSLGTEVVALLSAKTQFSVSLATLKIADESQRSAIDLIA